MHVTLTDMVIFLSYRNVGDCSMFRHPYVPTPLCSDTPMFRHPYVPTPLLSDCSTYVPTPLLFRHPYFPTAEPIKSQSNIKSFFRPKRKDADEGDTLGDNVAPTLAAKGVYHDTDGESEQATCTRYTHPSTKLASIQFALATTLFIGIFFLKFQTCFQLKSSGMCKDGFQYTLPLLTCFCSLKYYTLS